jgi:hypothetical protein
MQVSSDESYVPAETPPSSSRKSGETNQEETVEKQ